MKIGIIYKFENKINHKIYIGQTINEKRRLNEHIKSKNSDYMLIDSAILKYGFNNFSYEKLYEMIIETKKDKEILNKKEIEYIEEYNCRTPNGYNILKGGHCVSGSDNPMYGKQITEKHRENLRKSHIGKPNPMKGKHYAEDKKNEIVSKYKKTIQQKYDNGYIAQRKDIMLFKNGIHIGTYPNAKEIERNFGIDYKRIHNALKRKCPLDEEYIFMYKEEYSKELLNEISNNPSIHKKETKMVKQMDMQGNLVDILKLSEATKKFGKHVSDVCNGKRKNCKGYNFEWLLTK